MVLTVLLQLWFGQVPGCVKDTDCKGERICEAGVCAAPVKSVDLAAPPPPPPLPLPAPLPPAGPDESWPRVVRRDGLVCVQSLNPAGLIEESCRRDEPATPSSRPRPRVGMGRPDSDPRREDPPPAEPRARFVADVLFQGGVAVLSASGASLALPQINGLLSLGARFRSGVGVVAVGSLSGGFGPGGFGMVVGTVAPGLRFGDRGHFILAAGASVLGYSGGGASGAGVMGSVLAQGVFAVTGPFALALQGALHADASGAMFIMSAGFGFGAL